MPRCPHCTHEFAISRDFRCPACGADVRAGRGRPTAAGTSEVSDAGPGLQGEATSWMARLEAARRLASSHPPVAASRYGAHGKSDDVERIDPPSLDDPLRTPDLEGKPAHLLIAQLEREESNWARDEAARVERVFEAAAPKEEIAKVQVAVAAPKKPWRLPPWLGWATVGVLVVLGVGFAYSRAQDEPRPVAEIDPAKVAAARRTKGALTALQKGHEAVLSENHDDAIRLYREALRLVPDLASAERGLGIAYAATGNRKAAVKHYERFVQLEPDSLEAAKIKALIKAYKRKRRRR